MARSITVGIRIIDIRERSESDDDKDDGNYDGDHGGSDDDLAP